MTAAIVIIAIAAISVCANDTVALVVIVVCALIALLGIGG